MNKILWLASWYPNRVEPLNGDFIERHARAVSLLHFIFVIHVLKDHSNITPGKVFTEDHKYNERFRARIIYYKTPFKNIKWLDRVVSGLQLFRYFLGAVKQYLSQNGKPDLVHVHVSLKAGFVGLYLKWFHKIPYVITEHWTGFCPEAKPNFSDRGWVTRWLWRKVMKDASAVTTVSHYLGEAIQTRLHPFNYVVIPNVVDTILFQPSRNENDGVFRFIHVSTLTDQKNPREILEAISILSTKTDRKFALIIYGPEKPGLISLTRSLNIDTYVRFKKEVRQEILSVDMKKADALILYSSFETFGCVIIEANACGVPVIVSDIPVLHENVEDGLTGIFVPLHKPELLAEKMLWMMNHNAEFDARRIADFAGRYAFSRVAGEFDALYRTTLKGL